MRHPLPGSPVIEPICQPRLAEGAANREPPRGCYGLSTSRLVGTDALFANKSETPKEPCCVTPRNVVTLLRTSEVTLISGKRHFPKSAPEAVLRGSLKDPDPLVHFGQVVTSDGYEKTIFQQAQPAWLTHKRS